jgi:hypothetical protein
VASDDGDAALCRIEQVVIEKLAPGGNTLEVLAGAV